MGIEWSRPCWHRKSFFLLLRILAGLKAEDMGAQYRGWRPDSIAWSKEAEDLIFQALEQNQFPEDCHSKPWIAALQNPEGLGFRIQTFKYALLFGLVLNRTVVPYPSKGADFSHIFRPYTHCGFHIYANNTNNTVQPSQDRYRFSYEWHTRSTAR